MMILDIKMNDFGIVILKARKTNTNEIAIAVW